MITKNELSPEISAISSVLRSLGTYVSIARDSPNPSSQEREETARASRSRSRSPSPAPRSSGRSRSRSPALIASRSPSPIASRSPSPIASRRKKKKTTNHKKNPYLVKVSPNALRYEYDPHSLTFNMENGEFQTNRLPNKACRYLLSHCSKRHPLKRDQLPRHTVINIKKR